MNLFIDHLLSQILKKTRGDCSFKMAVAPAVYETNCRRTIYVTKLILANLNPRLFFLFTL